MKEWFLQHFAGLLFGSVLLSCAQFSGCVISFPEPFLERHTQKKMWKTIAPKPLFRHESNPNKMCGNCLHYYICCSHLMNEQWPLPHSPQRITELVLLRDYLNSGPVMICTNAGLAFINIYASLHILNLTCRAFRSMFPGFLVWFHSLNVHFLQLLCFSIWWINQLKTNCKKANIVHILVTFGHTDVHFTPRSTCSSASVGMCAYETLLKETWRLRGQNQRCLTCSTRPNEAGVGQFIRWSFE